MTPTNDPHPSPEQLAAFSLDQLASGERLAVAAHLTRCDACRGRLAAPGDNGQVTLAEASAPLQENSSGADTAGYTALEGSSATNAVPAELAKHPRYRVLGLLGSGGMGTVYKAQHLLMERVVALKVLRKNLTDRPAAVERFRQEVKAAARLAHPNIVTAYDADNAGELHFLVTEYVEGRSLDRVLAEGRPVAVADACEWVRQAALGLQHAYERGMVHRDIKPHNLMLTPSPPPLSPSGERWG